MLDQKIAEEGTKRGFHVLDAPVTGGDTGAKAGTLSILVGGSKEDYEACMPLFKAMEPTSITRAAQEAASTQNSPTRS